MSTVTQSTQVQHRERLRRVAQAAYEIRMGVLEQGEAQGEGYVGQALGIADVLAAVYCDTLRHRPEDPQWEGRDRFLLSIGHYALASYAAFAAAGIIPREELLSYAADGSRLPMSGMKTYTPGMEISGGSLGHGLGQAVGMALGLRHQGRGDQLVYNLLSDGELNEGSTWEAAMSASHWQLGNLVALVDLNGLQADGRTDDVLRLEPQEDRWSSFGWRSSASTATTSTRCSPRWTGPRAPLPHRAAPTWCSATRAWPTECPCSRPRRRLHFLRVAAEEWPIAKEQLTAGHHQKDAR